MSHKGSDADPAARAWALKDAAYAAWSSDPTRTAQAARELRHHALAHPALPLIGGLACWAEGVAALAQADMAGALDHLVAAEAALSACGEHLAAAQTQVPCIMALAMLGRHEASVACASQARQRLEALGDTVGAAKVSLNLAALHIRRGQGAAAIDPARRASALFARIADHEHSVMGDVSLADALSLAGDLDEALRIYDRAGSRAARHGLPVLQALVDESRALIDVVRGAWRQALQGLESARRRYAELGLSQHQAIAEKQLADVYLELRLLPEAQALADAAVQRFAELELPDERAAALLQRAQIGHQRDNEAAAQADLQAAAALFEQLDHAHGLAAVRLAQAELALACGEAATADALAAQALQQAGADAAAAWRQRAELVQARARIDLDPPDVAQRRLAQLLGRAQDQQLGPQAVMILTELGVLARRRGDVDAARAQWRQAIELGELQRQALPGSDLRRGFAAVHQRPYLELLALDLAQGADALQLLRGLERYRARAGDVPPAPACPEAGTDPRRERLDWLYRRRQRLADEGRFDAQADAEARQIEFELLESARRVRIHDGAPAVGGDAHFDPASLCQTLGAAQAVLVFAVIDGELLAVVLRQGRAHLRRHVARWTELVQACQALHNQMLTLVAGVERLAPHLPQLTARATRVLHQLHGLLWAPLRDALHGCEQVLLVPTGVLADLPWHAVAAAGDARASVPQVALAGSARAAWASLRTRPWSWPAQAAAHVLALADTQRLTHAGEEARAVAAVHPGCEVFEGAQATRATLQAKAATARVLHLICHARFRRDNPSFSALQLADGEMTVEQVAGLPLHADLVVLSACDSARADAGAADDGVGLVQAFQGAGSGRVLASLWPVHDAVGAQWMAALHRSLAAGDPPARALQVAQRDVASRHPHPFFWAPFTLHGGW